MSIIKQIAVYNGTTWETDDIGTDATKVSTTAVTGQNNVEGALTALKSASNIGLNPNVLGQNNVQSALNQISGKIGSADISTIGSDITSAITSLNTTINSLGTATSTALDNKVSKTGDTMTGSLNFKGSSNTNNSAVISFNDEDSSVSGLTLEGSKNISNNKIYNSLSLRINSNGEPIVDVDSNSSSPVDSAWRNAIKAFGKYGDEQHYGSIFIQPDPENTDPTSDFSQGVAEKVWSGIAWRDKNDVEMSLLRGYSHTGTDLGLDLSQMGLQIDSRYKHAYNSAPSELIGRNILEIGVDSIGDPKINISAVAYDNSTDPATQFDQTSIAQAAWRKAITESSKIARVMNIGILTTDKTQQFNANEIKNINIEINNANTLASDYTWNTFAGPLNVFGHSHQDKLSFLAFYPGNITQSGNRTVNVLVQNISNQSITDTITVRTLWFAIHNGTVNI